MSLDRAEIVHQNFIQCLKSKSLPNAQEYDISNSGLESQAAIRIFESQVLSRHLDLTSRSLQKRGESFYTIGSSGHEGNAAVAASLRLNDMAFLHYRDAAFFIERAKQLESEDPLWDILLSFSASSEEPNQT